MVSPGFKPYLLRAFYSYLTDQGFTPYIHVYVNQATQVPMSYVQDETITLNIGPIAAVDLKISSQWVDFRTRFSGKIEGISIPIGHILLIYAKEEPTLILNFPLEIEEEAGTENHGYQQLKRNSTPKEKSALSKRHLRVVKGKKSDS